MPLGIYERSLDRLLIHNVRKSFYSSKEYEQFTENLYLCADLTSFCVSMYAYETFLFIFLLVVSFCSVDRKKWPVHLSRQRVGYATQMVSSALI